MPEIKTGSLQFPGLPTSRRVWIGSYGGHFSVVVVFNKKPKKARKGEWNAGQYCTLLNKDIIAGSFDQDSFNEWFGTNIEADDTEIVKVDLYDLTAIWDQYNCIVGLHTNYDN